MENLFGNDPKWKFENVAFGETADTMTEAIEMVEADIKKYVADKIALAKKKELEDEPFPSAPRYVKS